MNTRIRNALKQIGTPTLAVILVLSMLSAPVAATSAVQINGSGIDDSGQYIIVENTGTEAKTLGTVTIGSSNTTASPGISMAAGDIVTLYLGAGTDDATNDTYYLGLDSADYDRHEEDVTVEYSDGTASATNTVLWWADAGADQTTLVNNEVTVDAYDTYSDVTIVSYDTDATGATANWTYDTAGTYDVLLTVTSDRTGSQTDTMTVTVEEPNSAPVLDTGLDPATNITATVNESVSFDATNSTDADGDSLTYSWDFDGDGTTDSTNATATYTYDTAGTYNASLTVSDGTDSVSETYTVVVEESTDDGTTTTEEPVGGGSGSDGLSTESILAIIGSFLFLVAVGVAVKRIA